MANRSGSDVRDGIMLTPEAMGRLMPMHVIVRPTGHIVSAGPTLAKLLPDCPLEGRRFLELFQLRRPRDVTGYADLAAATATPLALRLRNCPDTAFRGLAVALPGQAGLLINLSFGIGAVEAVGRYRLTSADFPATDVTVEMLYLVEAKEAVMEESRSLNRRLQVARTAAEERAFTDTLTGLKNRRAMDHILDRYTRLGDSFSLMQVDLDFFKAVNDTLGHAAGDHVLQEVARILVEETRSDDTIVRAGGDEFVLIFHRLTDPDRLARIAGRILARLEEPIPFNGAPCRISASIGITVSDDYECPTADQMLIDADTALYASKKAGRARHTFGGQHVVAPPDPQVRLS